MSDTIGCVGVMNGKDGVRGRYSPFQKAKNFWRSFKSNGYRVLSQPLHSPLHLKKNATIRTFGTETIHAPSPNPPWISPFTTVHVELAIMLTSTIPTVVQNIAFRFGPSMMYIPHPTGRRSVLCIMLSSSFCGSRSSQRLRGWSREELR